MAALNAHLRLVVLTDLPLTALSILFSPLPETVLSCDFGWAEPPKELL